MAEVRDKIRTIRVAAVQMESRLGQIEANLEHATPLVEQAARDSDTFENLIVAFAVVCRP
jgi:predicted amidohydrolase